MNHLLHVRSAVLGVIEKARGNKQVFSWITLIFANQDSWQQAA
jgi:hypothetical protein